MSEWTVDTLKEYIDTRFDAVREAITKADTAGELRAAKLETSTSARFESVNEFRNQTKDLQSNFMPRAEFDAAVKSLDEKIKGKNILITISTSGAVVAMLVAVFNFASIHG